MPTVGETSRPVDAELFILGKAESVTQDRRESCSKGPPILSGVVREGEYFDFCMCNPPFFESMEEAGLNPKTSCGGTPEEMVCPGGDREFTTCIIEDSVLLKNAFRWFTSMIGRKANLKFLMSKLREVGISIVKTTEFVQGQTCRWALAWSFVSPSKKKVVASNAVRSSYSFTLETVPCDVLVIGNHLSHPRCLAQPNAQSRTSVKMFSRILMRGSYRVGNSLSSERSSPPGEYLDPRI